MNKNFAFSTRACALARTWMIAALATAATVATGALVFRQSGTSTELLNRYQYDESTRLSSHSLPTGYVASYKYDASNRPTRLTYARALGRLKLPLSEHTRSFEYNSAGTLTAATNSAGTIRLGYDDVGRLIDIHSADGRNLKYEYDPWGQVRRITLPGGGSIGYERDTLGYLRAVDDGKTRIEYSREPDLNRVTRRLPNGIATVYTTSLNGKLESIQHINAAGSVLCGYRYTYDALNRVETVEEQANSRTTTTRYEYDDNGSLARASSSLVDIRFTYDVMGNIRSEVSGSSTKRFEYDALGRLTKAGTATFRYDNAGNLVEKREGGRDGGRTTVYTYDPDSHLIEVRTPEHTDGVIRVRCFGQSDQARRRWQGDRIPRRPTRRCSTGGCRVQR